MTVKSFARKVVKTSVNRLFRAVMPPYAVSARGEVFVTSRKMTASSYLALLIGEYEAAERNILRTRFNRSSAIVEIGSNIGIVASLALATKLEPKGKIVCVEPNSDSFDALHGNLNRALKKREGDGIDLSVVYGAVSGPKEATGGRAEFIQRADLSSGLSGQVAAKSTDALPVDVKVMTLTDLLGEQGIDGPYSLICDAEGAEIPMIFEDAAALTNCTQMLIELHEPALTGRADVPPEAMVREIERQGFVLHERQLHTYYFSRPTLS